MDPLEQKQVAVITSEAARDDLDTIRMRHSDMLKGMQEQSMRRQQTSQAKEAEVNVRMDADRAYKQKQDELDIKRMQTYGLPH